MKESKNDREMQGPRSLVSLGSNYNVEMSCQLLQASLYVYSDQNHSIKEYSELEEPTKIIESLIILKGLAHTGIKSATLSILALYSNQVS